MSKPPKVPCPKCGGPMNKGSLACYKCSHEVMKKTMFRQSHNARTRKAREAQWRNGGSGSCTEPGR
jgi:hypothetical protein